jgi:hypothetical protein
MTEHFCDDAGDILASLPPETIKTLQSCGYLEPNSELVGEA